MAAKIPVRLKIQEPAECIGAALEYPYSDELAKRLTLISRFEEPFALYKQTGDKILVPRNLTYAKPKKDARNAGESIKFTMNFHPRNEEQSRVVDECANLLMDGKSHILQAPTGFGKTYVGAAVIGRLGVKSLIIVTKEDLKSQWVSAVRAVLGLDDSEIGFIQGNKCAVAGKKVVIGMIQSLYKEGNYPDWAYNDYGLVLFDEVHLLGADKFNQACYQLPAKLRFGLSATPTRKDGKDVVFHAHIGTVDVETAAIPMIPKVYIYNTGWAPPKAKTKDGTLVPMKLTAGRTQHVSSMMAVALKRNKLIAELAMMGVRKKRDTIIFSDQKEHLENIRQALMEANMLEHEIGLYVGGMSKSDLDKNSAKKVVLATYGMTMYGTDCPWWNMAIMATPRADVAQIVGRILREYPDKPQPVVFDLVDDHPVFKGYFNGRAKFYKQLGAAIKIVK